MSPITAFRGEYSFLSNFYPASITVEGKTYPTVEHAFQALKTLDAAERQAIRKAPPQRNHPRDRP